MDNLTHRIEIINSFKLLNESRIKATSLSIRNSNIDGIIHLVLSICVISIISYGVLADFLGLEFGPNWGKSSLIVICSISVVYELSKDLYKRILLKHLQIIEKSRTENMDISLNDDLEAIVSDLNKPQRNVYIIILGVLVMVGAVLHSFNESPYWDYFKIPTILFFILVAFETTQNLRRLKTNITQTEGQL